jgi:hypothetical protein
VGIGFWPAPALQDPEALAMSQAGASAPRKKKAVVFDGNEDEVKWLCRYDGAADARAAPTEKEGSRSGDQICSVGYYLLVSAYGT